MTRIRLRPAGFDARPERPSSLRAQAQRVFRAAAARDESLKGPTPDPSPQGGGEQAALVEPQHVTTPLTKQVRVLYEDSAVPVREIARLAGVSERTLYKYVAKGGWRRRHATQDIASAVMSLRRPRACVTAKGAGGRFIRAADAAQPIRRGLKALDPQGEARAQALCERAATLSDEARARTRRLREATSDARIIALLAGVLRDVAAVEDAGQAGAKEQKTAPERTRRRYEWRPVGVPPAWADRKR